MEIKLSPKIIELLISGSCIQIENQDGGYHELQIEQIEPAWEFDRQLMNAVINGLVARQVSIAAEKKQK